MVRSISKPVCSKTWSIKDLIKIADKHKLTLYSTSPIFFDGNNLKWYKDLKSYSASSKKIIVYFINHGETIFYQ